MPAPPRKAEPTKIQRTAATGQPRWSASATLTPPTAPDRGRASGGRWAPGRWAPVREPAGAVDDIATIQADPDPTRTRRAAQSGSAQGFTGYPGRPCAARMRNMSQNDSTPPLGTPANPYGGPQTGF